MDHRPMISIVIPARDAGESLNQCLASIYQAAPPETEVILADNGSCDPSSRDACGIFPQIRYLQCSEVRGAAYARNRGMALTRGEWIFFVDADVSLDQQSLFLLLEHSGQADIVFPSIYDYQGKLLSPKNAFARSRCLNSAVFGIRRTAAARMDALFDEVIEIYGEDNDFFLRAHRIGLRFCYVPQAVAFHPERKLIGEGHYYLTVRNAVYVWMKLRGLVHYWMPMDLWMPVFLFAHLAAAITNRSISERGVFYTTGSRFNLVRLFGKACAWNWRNASLARSKRKAFRQFIMHERLGDLCES